MSDFFLPEALMLNIWLRLPIKSTVRFRCVSKSWCASLSDPHFIYKNLTFFDAENEHDLLLVLDRERQYYSVVSHETLVATARQVSPLREVPSADVWYRAILTSSCDDLVCFHNESAEVIGVWNLTTGETKIVPPVSDDGSPMFTYLTTGETKIVPPVSDDGSPMFTFQTLGFGFDEKRKDYKIVQILRDRSGFVAYVYSLGCGNNCWRKLDEPNVPSTCYKGSDYGHAPLRSYRDGTFYWGSLGDFLIVSFDMSGEVFNTISIPQHPYLAMERFCKMKEGSMFIIMCCDEYHETDGISEFEIWALLEVGVTQSWTKVLNIGSKVPEKPLGFWRNELVFRSYNNGCRLHLRDVSKGETKEVRIDETLDISSCLVWTKMKNSIPLN